MNQLIHIDRLKRANAELVRVCKELRSDLWYQLTSKHDPAKIINYPSIKDADILLRHLKDELEQPPRLMIPVTVTRRSDDFHACLTGFPQVWGYGRTPSEALGEAIAAHPELFGIQIEAEYEKGKDKGSVRGN